VSAVPILTFLGSEGGQISVWMCTKLWGNTTFSLSWPSWGQ